MSPLSIQQLRGLKNLIQEAIAGGANEIEEVHRAIARQPFALLKKIGPIAMPVKAVECVQGAVTGCVYRSIHAVNQIAGTVATQVLDRLEEQQDLPKPP